MVFYCWTSVIFYASYIQLDSSKQYLKVATICCSNPLYPKIYKCYRGWQTHDIEQRRRLEYNFRPYLLLNVRNLLCFLHSTRFVKTVPESRHNMLQQPLYPKIYKCYCGWQTRYIEQRRRLEYNFRPYLLLKVRNLLCFLHSTRFVKTVPESRHNMLQQPLYPKFYKCYSGWQTRDIEQRHALNIASGLTFAVQSRKCYRELCQINRNHLSLSTNTQKF